MKAGITVAELLHGLADVAEPLAGAEVTGLSLDSRSVQPGGAFVAVAAVLFSLVLVYFGFRMMLTGTRRFTPMMGSIPWIGKGENTSFTRTPLETSLRAPSFSCSGSS